MKAESLLYPVTIKGLYLTTTEGATLGLLTPSGNYMVKCLGPMSSISIHLRTDSNGSAVIAEAGSKAIQPSSPRSTSDRNLHRSLTDLLMKYWSAILISYSLWVILLSGLYVAELASVSFVVLLSTLLTASLVINSYL